MNFDTKYNIINVIEFKLAVNWDISNKSKKKTNKTSQIKCE